MDILVLTETIMVFCFGISWPLSVYKSWTSKTSKGKSLLFELAIWFGYLAGLIGKFVTQTYTIALVFYLINITMVSIDIILYFRNAKLDKIADQKQALQ
ncbi:MAG: hypothetical protein Q4E22_04105 [Coriobacteriia bacterium]|nr:hypothetical protein [Coriobacteriia bacterium]